MLLRGCNKTQNHVENQYLTLHQRLKIILCTSTRICDQPRIEIERLPVGIDCFVHRIHPLQRIRFLIIFDP